MCFLPILSLWRTFIKLYFSHKKKHHHTRACGSAFHYKIYNSFLCCIEDAIFISPFLFSNNVHRWLIRWFQYYHKNFLVFKPVQWVSVICQNLQNPQNILLNTYVWMTPILICRCHSWILRETASICWPFSKRIDYYVFWSTCWMRRSSSHRMASVPSPRSAQCTCEELQRKRVPPKVEPACGMY